MSAIETGFQPGDAMWRWWACFIGGLCGPIAAHVLVEWMPAALAVGLAVFIMWTIVGAIFTVSPPSSRWSFARWTGAGAVGGLIAGALAFIVHA